MLLIYLLVCFFCVPARYCRSPGRLSPQNRIAELEAAGGTGGTDGMVSAEEFEAAAAELQNEHKAELEKLERELKTKHAADVSAGEVDLFAVSVSRVPVLW